MAVTIRSFYASAAIGVLVAAVSMPIAAFATTDQSSTGKGDVGQSICVITDDGKPFEVGSIVTSCDPVPEQPSIPAGEPLVSSGDARYVRGAAPIGTAVYPTPTDGVFVAPNGSDEAAGSQSEPFATIQRAITRAPSGATIVIRQGVYRESILLPRNKKLTLQPFPNEEVWLDGSRDVTTWERSGSVWVSRGWNVDFDTSPTYTRGAPDNTSAAWSFLNPSYPLAANPDQVWFGETAFTQVGSVAAVKESTFYVDRKADLLVVGSDPSGVNVAASVLVNAIRVTAPDTTIRGIGIRRYAPSVPDMGAVAVYGAGVSLENVAITDSATTGLSVNAARATVSDVTIARSGMLGMHANYADNLKVSRLLSADNNLEHFNRAPVSGGLKITRSRTVEVAQSTFLRNEGNALWFDESVWNGAVTGNDILDNTGNGIVIELSARFVVADNVVARNLQSGLLIDGSDQVNVWNNSIVQNDRGIKVAQGDRRASSLSTAGHDPRQSLPDPTVTWITEGITIANNILSTTSGKRIVGVEDYTHERSAAQMRVTSNGNVVHRTTSTNPAWAFVWSRGQGDPAVYSTVSAFSAATGQDRRSVAVDGPSVFNRGWSPISNIATQSQSVALPIPPVVTNAFPAPLPSGVVGAIPN